MPNLLNPQIWSLPGSPHRQAAPSDPLNSSKHIHALGPAAGPPSEGGGGGSVCNSPPPRGQFGVDAVLHGGALLRLRVLSDSINSLCQPHQRRAAGGHGGHPLGLPCALHAHQVNQPYPASARAWRAYTRSGGQSREGGEHIPGAGAKRERVESI
eukprot:1172682-Prorocentrum_minimum.AAC.7